MPAIASIRYYAGYSQLMAHMAGYSQLMAHMAGYSPYYR